MRPSYLLAVFSFFLLLNIQPAQAVVHVWAGDKTEHRAEETSTLSKKELRKNNRLQRKAFKKEIKAKLKQLRQETDTDLLLLVIIAILLPPLAMGLYDGITTRFWISLLLTLLFYLPGLIYTLVVILGEN
ncbi:MAG: YqaE/Pmp3 family membrane protein [Phaeodactylibacter sp.]|nr:YqaE/Pmp3 family membrane protein [Phaeodactylibacter sp.]